MLSAPRILLVGPQGLHICHQFPTFTMTLQLCSVRNKCAHSRLINLLTGPPVQPHPASPSLTQPKGEAMEKYITDSLSSGIIHPSSSPVGAGFFFVERKDKTLRPCIDYRELNKITIKNKYPLTILNSAFELLQGISSILQMPTI